MSGLWYAVSLKNGVRQSEGVQNMGSRAAMEAHAERHPREMAERFPGFDRSEWTMVVVDRAGLDALPMKQSTHEGR